MIEISATEALEMPVDELALLALADIVKTDEWNEYNYLNSYKHDRLGLGYQQNPKAREAISEATGWLRSQGMIARAPAQSADAAIFVTRWGRQALKSSLAEIRAVHRIQVSLHSSIHRKVRRQFLLGEYENAIFVAMKSVEVRVRKLAGYGDEMIGVPMMTQAFKSGGPLADPVAPAGEVEGTMALFRGAYAVLRNPSGHREVSFDDVTEASEAVMTASLLMHMLDKIEARIAAP
ncbi:TIGR02391 family protein [Amycolatopsis azurea]|uniref:TIGR02391 family protein n=1 Tax=Amycolatopsis azurea TaxID=36819 RepID=UPI0037FA4115